jgi:hypothetical protein
MGVTVSHNHSPWRLHPTINQWICPKCSSYNPMSGYPICHICYQQNRNVAVHFPKVPLKPMWHCVSCTYENQADHRFCNICGKAKFPSVGDPSNKDS